jgi:hypothetical protein
MGIVTGKDARVWISSGNATLAPGAETQQTHSTYAISDFGLTLARGTVEQPLIGETGNYWSYGGLTIDGTYTNCRFGTKEIADDLYSIINSKMIRVSGNAGSSLLKWYFTSCQVTGFDVKFGDANTITNASVSFTIMDPFMVLYDPIRGCISNTV